MEWVEGFTLNEFVRQQVGRADMLRALLGMWVRLCKRLREAEIAHADLQHGNVLLVPGETANKLRLRLIDYDGMWVPDLAGKPSGEAGHPAYQHPARLRDKVYSADVDRFPHLVIGCALRALAVAGKPLFDQFDNGDNLLFRETDFAHPEKSKLFRALWDLDDPTVTNLVALLVMSARRPVRDTPWLDELLEGEKAEPVGDAVLARAAAALGVRARAARRAAPTAQIYSVPEEANAFANLMDDADGRPRPRRRRRRTFPLIPAIVGGTIVAGAGVMIAVLLGMRGKDNPDPPPSHAGTSLTTGAPTATGTGTGKVVPGPIVKKGSLETRWIAVEARRPVTRTANLAAGLDANADATFLRPYVVRGAGSLGLWLLPDGSTALVAGRNGIGRLDLKSGKVEPLLADLEIVRAAVTPDGRIAVVADKEQTIRGYELESGDELFSHAFPFDEPVLVITPDAKRVAATAPGVGYVEWTLADGQEIRRHASLQASALAFSPDGKKAVAADRDGGIELWDLDTGTARFLAADARAAAVAVTPDGTRVVAVLTAPGREIRSWTMADGRALPARPLPVRHPTTALAVAADGTPVIGTAGGEVAVVPAGASSHLAFVATQDIPVTALALTADGKHLLAGTDRASIYLTRTAAAPDGTVPRVDPKSEPPSPAPPWLAFVGLVAAPPDASIFAADARGDRFLVAGKDRVTVFDAVKLQSRDSVRLAEGEIVGAGFGPDNTIVLCERAADRKHRTRAWDLSTTEPGPAFAITSPPGSSMAGFAHRIVPVPDRPWVIARTIEHGDTLFDPKTGKVVAGWPAARPADEVAAAPSPDGKVIAVGSAVRPIQLWDCDTATVGPVFAASVGFANLAFAPDGKQLIGSGGWGRIRIWDVETGEVVREVDHEQTGSIASVTPLGNNLAAVYQGGIWLVMHLVTGNVAGAVEDPLGPGLTLGRRGLVIARTPDKQLAAWKVLPARVAQAPARRPRPHLHWPDVKLVRDGPRGGPVGLVFAPDGRDVVSAVDGFLTRYSVGRLRFEKEVEAAEGPIRAMALAKGKLFTLGRKTVCVRDPDTLDQESEYPVTIAGTNPLVFAVHPDAKVALLATDRLRELNFGTKKEAYISPPRAAAGKPLTQFVWAANGKLGVARWGNEIVTVWQPRQISEVKVLEDLKAAVPATAQGLALSEDGTMAALGTRTGELRVWDTKTGKLLHSDSEAYHVEGSKRSASIEAVRFLPDGKQFVTVGGDGRTIVWQVDGFRKVKEIKGPSGPGWAALSPDGKTLVVQQSQYMQLVELPGPAEQR
jgi:WD40 repeat protein